MGERANVDGHECNLASNEICLAQGQHGVYKLLSSRKCLRIMNQDPVHTQKLFRNGSERVIVHAYV